MKIFIMSGNGYVCMIPYLIVCAKDRDEALKLAAEHDTRYFKRPDIDAELPYFDEAESGFLKYWEIHI